MDVNKYLSLRKRLDDLIAQSSYREVESDFLYPNEIKFADEYLKNKTQYVISGGRKDAIKQKIFFTTNTLVCLQAKYNSKYRLLKHKDVLGALFNVGITHDSFGDIYVDDQQVIVYCSLTTSKIIISNLTKINQMNIKFKSVPFIDFEDKYLSYFDTCSSLRIDNVCAMITNLSRSKVNELFLSQYVMLNYEICENYSTTIEKYDIISLRYYGKYRILDCQLNKKNKYKISYIKYD
ncbi:MAG: YlmH/Sll1252 family protein [Erysipelotrichaceae bacterium]